MKQNEINFIETFTEHCHPSLASSALPAASVRHACPPNSEASASFLFEWFSPYLYPGGMDSSEWPLKHTHSFKFYLTPFYFWLMGRF
jgi:hypothetical protein